jgi:small redox-active disulfide protein 2
MEIRVFGPGCAKCVQLEKLVTECVAEKGVAAQIIKVTDFKEMAQYGIFTTPAVAIDGEVKAAGRIPKKDEIFDWLHK